MFKPGSLIKEMGIAPGAPVTKDVLENLQSGWLEIYLAFHLLLSTNPDTQARIDALKGKLAEVNEAMGVFFDSAL